MKTRTLQKFLGHSWLLLTLAVWPALGNAQVAVADIEAVEELPIATTEELETLVGPIALYPDDLLAIVLPASTFPLQIIEAARFLEALEVDPSLEPDEDWNDAIVALLNYPEVLALLNEDLEWMWRLGEAVAAQQADVIAAIELFRDRAYAAGNLKTDDYQVVTVEDSTIQITPVEEDVIYVPYYEPERVVVYQPRPVYYYYPRAYPVYYYPYPSYHAFHDSFFWGVTTAFSIGWHHHHLNVYHHSYYGHPYYGRSYYWDNYWYRRPSINVYNNVYVNNRVHVTNDRYRDGDRWYPSSRRTIRSSDQRVTRSRYYPPGTERPSSVALRKEESNASFPSPNRSGVAARTDGQQRQAPSRTARGSEPTIKFKDRPELERTRPSTVKPTVTRRESTTKQPNKSQAVDPRLQQSVTRKSQTKQPTIARSLPKQPAVRQSQPTVKQTPSRQPTVRQPTVRQSQPTVKQAPSRQPTVKQAPSRQPTVRQSQPRQSQPRVTQSRPTQSARASAPSRSSSPQRSQSSSSKSSSSNSSNSSNSSSKSGSSNRSGSKSRDR
jgi:hypothetical protein